MKILPRNPAKAAAVMPTCRTKRETSGHESLPEGSTSQGTSRVADVKYGETRARETHWESGALKGTAEDASLRGVHTLRPGKSNRQRLCNRMQGEIRQHVLVSFGDTVGGDTTPSHLVVS